MTSSIRVYHYPKCSSCKKALSFLRERNIPFEAVDIVLSPPSRDEIRAMIERKGSIRKIFNTSGILYREGGFASKISSMTNDEAVETLASSGMLIKRPFVLTERHALLGFSPEEWGCLDDVPR